MTEKTAQTGIKSGRDAAQINVWSLPSLLASSKLQYSKTARMLFLNTIPYVNSNSLSLSLSLSLFI